MSATIDEKTEELVEKLLRNKKFRNKSHIIEQAIELLAKEEKIK